MLSEERTTEQADEKKWNYIVNLCNKLRMVGSKELKTKT